MATKYDFERRLHSLVKDMDTLSDYYTEYQGYLGTLTPRESGKFQREIEHKFFELSGVAYQNGDLP